VDPVPEPLLFRKSGSARYRTRTSGSVARHSDHKITEAVGFLIRNPKISNKSAIIHEQTVGSIALYTRMELGICDVRFPSELILQTYNESDLHNCLCGES
jgi:hypothetical protein